MHLGDGHIKAECSWPSAPRQLYNSLLLLSITPRGAGAASPCSIFFHQLLKAFSSSPRLHLLLCPHFVELSALRGWGSCCLNNTVPHTQSQAKAGCLFRFVASSIYSITFFVSGSLRECRCCTFQQECVHGASARRPVWGFTKQSLCLLLSPEGGISALTFSVFIPCDLSSSRRSPPHPSMCTNHHNAACRTNSLEFQFHLTLTIIIKAPEPQLE